MGPALWVSVFVGVTAFAVWIVFFDGADRTGGLVASVWLGADIGDWSDDGIRLFVGAVWLVAAGWFLYGLVSPGARFGLW